ncbi:RecX family transcriptional regulator, partial [Chryseobacterium indologenes]
HLKQKQISERLMNKCFDEIYEDDYIKTISRIYEDYFSKQKGMPEYQRKSKTIKYLMSRGFEYEKIIDIFG